MQARFAVFWDDTSGLFPEQPSLMQFVCLMSIFTNEVGGDLVPIREKVGRPPRHPGIAYAFDRIEGLKRSYNTLAGNRTAFALFGDPAYREAHKMRGGFAAFADPAAISADNQGGGNYLGLADRAATLNGNGAGSIRRMGLRISGGADYAERSHQRVAELCAGAQSLP